MKNLVSIIIPFYKNFELFQICIRSVIKQTYKKIEIIIIYDGNESSIKKSLKDMPVFPPTHKLLGELHLAEGRKDEAEKEFSIFKELKLKSK